MRDRALGNALMVALISIILMLGALSISLVEFVPASTPPDLNMAQPSPLPITVTSTPLVFETAITTIDFTPTIAATSFSSCSIPLGWGYIYVQSFDTLDNISARYQTSKDQLRAGNCLLSDLLMPGTVLYVPPVSYVPTNTAVLLCNPNTIGWIKNYTVRPGDTLYSIATNYGATTASMKTVNCRTGDTIYAGEVLWVPNNPTRTPYPSLTPLPGNTAIPNPTESWTETMLPFTTTPVPGTPTPIPTNTPAPTLTASPTPFQ